MFQMHAVFKLNYGDEKSSAVWLVMFVFMFLIRQRERENVRDRGAVCIVGVSTLISE